MIAQLEIEMLTDDRHGFSEADQKVPPHEFEAKLSIRIVGQERAYTDSDLYQVFLRA